MRRPRGTTYEGRLPTLDEPWTLGERGFLYARRRSGSYGWALLCTTGLPHEAPVLLADVATDAELRQHLRLWRDLADAIARLGMEAVTP